jgi:serine/threonine protein kinase/tetratricopeptide (TPR) repeat protein
MQPGDLVDGRFELETVAGTGGMGQVFRARDQSGERVAIKVLRAGPGEGALRFQREIRVLQTLHHPAIVRYVADGRAPTGDTWLAMEWLEGESLQARLARTGLTAAESVTLARRVAEALGAAHDAGIIHRDVKPSNIMLPSGELDRAKLLDFGVARLADAARGATRTGVMIGTPGYMAPEQARGSKEVGPRADVFALGCVLFECLTGRHAFQGDNVMAVLAKILLDDAPRLRELRPELPAVLDELLARVLAKHPDQRPATGAQLAAELAAIGMVEPVERSPATETPPALTQTERQLLCVVLVGRPGGPNDHTLVDPSTDATLHSTAPRDGETQAEPIDPFVALRHVAQAHGAALVRLVDGSHVVTLAGGGDAGDQATRAARCALALKAASPALAMALATGRGVMAGRWPVGEAIDRAAALLAARDLTRVRVDEVTAGLLDSRFEIGGDEAGLALLGERATTEFVRTLLGKPTPCVGRDRELGMLFGMFEECISEPVARAVVITGAAGVGKSRVRYELLRRIRDKGEPVEIWIGRGDPLSAGSPFGMIAPALRRAAGILDGEPIEVRRGKLRARVMRHAELDDVSRTTRFLGELVGVPMEEEVELRAARQDPLLMAERVRRAFEHFVALETAAHPLVIALEDLQWGDLPTVKLIDSALRALPERPWLVLALARPDVHALFPRLWAERGAQELRLDELTKKGAEKLVRAVLGAQASDALVARLVDQAGGNAFYLEELVRAAAEGKGAIPDTVLAVVQGRLERIESDARRVLRAASVFGQQFWRGGVDALLGGASRDTGVRAWIDELVERELIARASQSRFPNEPQYYFRHAIVREAAYAMLTDSDRRLGHHLAGEWLELAGEGEPIVLAEHFERGGEPSRAIQCYQRAGEQALAACDFAAAAARAEHGIACGATGEALGHLRLVQAEAHKWSGEFSEAAARGLEALLHLPEGSPRWFSAAAETAEASGKIADAAQLSAIGEILRVAPDGDRAALQPRVTATAHCAFQLFNLGRYELAQVLLDRVERAAGDLEDPAILARIYQARSSRAMFSGDAGAYLESERAAAVQFERAGDLRYACMQRGHVGYACLEIGAYAEAEHWLRIALDEGARLGLANVVATAKHNLGRALQARGSLAEALAVETEALDEFTAQGDQRLGSAARSYRASILADLGELDEAEQEYRLSLEVALPPARPAILAKLAQLLMTRGSLAEAVDRAREGVELLDQLGAIEEGESLVRLVYAEALAAAGDPRAQPAARRARDRLLERAAQISDEHWRDVFLEQIAENARTLALGGA